MADVFISYKSERRDAAQHLARVLELHGYSVWFDYGLLSGSDFGPQIEREIRAAKSVVVLWCSLSRESPWVLEEAHLAKGLHTFTPTWLERVDPPLGFARAETIDLTIWDGAPRTHQLDRLLNEIARRVGRDPQPSFRGLQDYEKIWRSFGAPPLARFMLTAPVAEREEPRLGGTATAGDGKQDEVAATKLEVLPSANIATPASATGTGVVLLVPEALGYSPDPESLRRTLAGSPRPARVLLYLTKNIGHELAATLAWLGVDFQILLAEDAAEPKTKALCVRAPPGMSRKDQTEFALALADGVLVASKSDQHPVAQNASKLGMALIVPGDPLPLFAAETFAHRLDPGRRILPRITGRLEQGILELLAFAWLGPTPAGRAESRKRMRRCVTPGWRPGAYFAPDAWRDLSPDRAAIGPAAPIVASFEAMDRCALYGSFIHRDIAWLTHFGAAFAVFAAVAGFVFPDDAILWGFLEFVTLVAVAVGVFRTRRSGLQDRWTSCRLAAEQLRIARMSLPLFVLPPALATQDKPIAGDGDAEDKLERVALAQVKRAVRDQGLPRLTAGFNPEHAARWLHLIVSDQLEYHRRNYRKLEHAEKRLRLATQVIFAIAVIAVVAHLGEVVMGMLTHSHYHHEWLLLFTAAGPALAAALHGAGTRLGIVHRAALSEGMEAGLTTIDKALESFLKAPSETPGAWSEVRDLAYAAANTMGSENTSWHGLVRRYRDELP